MSQLFDPVASPYLVPFDGSFRRADAPTKPPKGKGAPDKEDNQRALAAASEALAELQATLYADDRYSVLLLFQAMDAAGKDGTIKAVLTGINPTGCQVYSFKAPSAEELDHDFLWRVQRCLPERGRIGVFNRSHYEEVLVVRVNPQFLAGQRLPRPPADLGALWAERYQSIRDAEQHWARSGVVVLKFWLNVSKQEQAQRLIERIDEPSGRWKFAAGDVRNRAQWDDYMEAYQDALAATSRPWAPWYAIPADSKSFMRRTVAEIVVGTLRQLPLRYPGVNAEDRAEMLRLRELLTKD